MVPAQIAFSIASGKLVARSSGAPTGDAPLIPGDGESIVEPRGEATRSESSNVSVPAQVAFFISGAYLRTLSAGGNAGEAAMNRVPGVGFTYLQPDGVSNYLQPDGVSLYLQPE